MNLTEIGHIVLNNHADFSLLSGALKHLFRVEKNLLRYFVVEMKRLLKSLKHFFVYKKIYN